MCRLRLLTLAVLGMLALGSATAVVHATAYGYDEVTLSHTAARAVITFDGLAARITPSASEFLSTQEAASGTSTTPSARSVATNTVDDVLAIGPSGNPGAFPFSGSTGLTSRASAREAIAGVSGATPEQIAAANRAIGRGTSTSTYNVGTFGERVVVQVQRPGANGYQVVETVVSPDGSKFVVQKAYDAAGQLVHYDPKTP